MTSHDPEASQTARPPRHWLRRVGIGLTALLVIVVALLAMLQVPPVATVVVRKLLTLVPLNPGNRIEVGHVSGDFLHHLVLQDLRLRKDGRELARIDRPALGYQLPRLRPPVRQLDSLR